MGLVERAEEEGHDRRIVHRANRAAADAARQARLEPGEERQSEGVPPGPVQSTASRGNSTQAAVRLPVCRRHMPQEQVWGKSGAPVALNRTWPQKQPPSNDGMSPLPRLRADDGVRSAAGRSLSRWPSACEAVGTGTGTGIVLAFRAARV